MISRTRIKFVKSLQVKKYRKQEQSFAVEGAKSVTELLQSSFDIVFIAATQQYITTHSELLHRVKAEVLEAKQQDLLDMGTFESNDAVVAVARMRPNQLTDKDENNYSIVLDNISDPGNLGTIIRTADWFGISSIIASEDTADFYNPKVIRSTMGSFCRVQVFYTSLPDFFKEKKYTSVYGAYLEGESIHRATFKKGSAILIGNESKGISQLLERFVTHKVTIPRIGQAESLNASVATAIFLDRMCSDN